MPTYLLTWKPTRSEWPTLDRDIRRLHSTGNCNIRWSVGVNKHVGPGDRAFLLRQGGDRAGILGSGRIVRGSYPDKHWDPKRSNKEGIFVRVRMNSLLYPERERILAREQLEFGSPKLWNTQASGVTIPPDVAKILEGRWSAHLKRLAYDPFPLADEVSDTRGFPDGGKQSVVVNRYERDPHNRAQCIAHFGYRCAVCAFDFEVAYGELGRNFIHVHHLVGLSTWKGRRRRVDPRTDLRPVCPNCHAMLHVGGCNRKIEDLRKVVRRRRR